MERSSPVNSEELGREKLGERNKKMSARMQADGGVMKCSIRKGSQSRRNLPKGVEIKKSGPVRPEKSQRRVCPVRNVKPGRKS